MTNPSYRAGVRFEYEVMNLLKKHLPKNCSIHRTAGSHSEADVIVTKSLGKQGRDRVAVLIQCKTKKKPKSTPSSEGENKINGGNQDG